MATEAKFSTVLPNNCLKGAVNATPVSQVYQERTNTLGPLENEFHANDVQLSLNTKDYGSTATVMIPPSYKLLNDAYIVFDIACGGGGDFTSDMIAYKILSQFIYRIPGCERMYFDGQNIPFMMLSNTENIHKRLRHIELSGTKELGSINKTIKVVAKLPLPCCSQYGDNELKPKPIPLHLIGEPVELLFKIQPTAAMCGFGSSGASISCANLYFNYSHLGAFAEYKNVVYKQMFDGIYDYEYVVPAAATGGERNVTMTGIRSGETTMLRIRCKEVNASDDKYTFNGLPLTDIKLRYAGQLIWQADGPLQESYHLDYARDVNYWSRKGESHSIAAIATNGTSTLTNLATTGTLTSGTVTGGVVANLAVTGTVTSGAGTTASITNVDKLGIRNYWYDLPIATILAHMKKHGYVLGADFNNSELKLTFTIASSINGIPLGSIGPATPVTDANVTAGVGYVSGNSHALEVTQFVNSIYQYNGERAVLIQ
jgi:hypothetical protein